MTIEALKVPNQPSKALPVEDRRAHLLIEEDEC